MTETLPRDYCGLYGIDVADPSARPTSTCLPLLPAAGKTLRHTACYPNVGITGRGYPLLRLRGDSGPDSQGQGQGQGGESKSGGDHLQWVDTDLLDKHLATISKML